MAQTKLTLTPSQMIDAEARHTLWLTITTRYDVINNMYNANSLLRAKHLAGLDHLVRELGLGEMRMTDGTVLGR